MNAPTPTHVHELRANDVVLDEAKRWGPYLVVAVDPHADAYGLTRIDLVDEEGARTTLRVDPAARDEAWIGVVVRDATPADLDAYA